jgi:hypothetical protein
MTDEYQDQQHPAPDGGPEQPPTPKTRRRRTIEEEAAQLAKARAALSARTFRLAEKKRTERNGRLIGAGLFLERVFIEFPPSSRVWLLGRAHMLLKDDPRNLERVESFLFEIDNAHPATPEPARESQAAAQAQEQGDAQGGGTENATDEGQGAWED